MKFTIFQAFALGALFILAGCAGGGGTFGTADSGTTYMVQVGAPGGPYSVFKLNLLKPTYTLIGQVGQNNAEGDYCNLTGMSVFVQTPSPSPTNPNPVANLYVLPKGSTTPIQKTVTTANHHNPRFSSDGNWIVFSEDVTTNSGIAVTSAIFKVSATGGASLETQLTAPQGLSQWPSVSPDGLTVIFAMTTIAGNYQLYTVPLAGGGITPVTADFNNYSSPMYSEDQTKILCAMETPSTLSTVSPPPPYQNSIVELPVNNVGTPSMVSAPPEPTTNVISGVMSWKSYGHPRYLVADKVVVFDSSSYSSTLVSPSSTVVEEWLRKSGAVSNAGDGLGTFEQVQGDE